MALVVLAVLAGVLGSVPPAQAADSVRTPSARIVNGDKIAINQAPWQVALLAADVPNTYQAQFCGGSIFDAEWVVTAAHCVVDNSSQAVDPRSLQILAGATELSTPAATPRRDVSQVIVHPAYNDQTQMNDIALLKLASPLPLDGTTTTTIALPRAVDPGWPAAGTQALVSGWGSISGSSGVYPTTLYAATVDVMTAPSETDCGSYGNSYDNATMLCAGTAADPVKDTCYGDSGGPLAVNDSGTWTLAGITSWGNGCAQVGYPGVYTRVTTYTDWIDSVVSPATDPGGSTAPPVIEPLPAAPAPAPAPTAATDQSVQHPAPTVVRGAKVRLSMRSSQGQVVTWKSRTKKTCTVSRGVLRAKKRGKCRLEANAPGTAAVKAYRHLFSVRIR